MDRLQVRRAEAVQNGETWLVGELVWSAEKDKFGIFPNWDATSIAWYPSVTRYGEFKLNPGQVLTGYQAEGEDNHLAFDWSQGGKLRIINLLTKATLLEATDNAITFNVANLNVTSVSNMSNLSINGDLSIVRTIGATGTHLSTDADTYMFAPNWLVWAGNTHSGLLSVSFDTTDIVLPHGTVDRTLKVTSSNNADDCGIRTFGYDYSFVKGQLITFMYAVKAPAGAAAQARIVNEIGGALKTVNIVGTGSWQTITIPQVFPNDNSTWWAVDLLYEPSKNSNSAVIWRIGGLQFNRGGLSSIYERRSKNVEQMMVDTIYQEGRFRIKEDETVSVELPHFLKAPTDVVFENPEDGVLTQSNTDKTGFDVFINGLTESSGATIKFAAMISPPVA